MGDAPPAYVHARVEAQTADEAPLPPLLLLTSGGLEHGGGIGRMIGYLIDEWRKSPDAPVFEVVDTRGPGPWRLWGRFFGGSVLRVLRRSSGHPLIHIHLAGRGSTLRKFLLVALARALHLPIVLHLHDYDYRSFCLRVPRPALAAIRWMFASADLTIVLGKEALETLVETLGVPLDRIAILPNAVPAGLRPARQRSSGPVEILFLGQLSVRKGVHDLIAALGRPELLKLDWRCTFAGGGPHAGAFEAQAAAMNIADRVRFLGWMDREATTELLRESDILALPSYAEGMAMSVLEGMSYGLCVVCTPVGALGEVIEDDVTGKLVGPGQIDDLATALSRCIRDDTYRSTLGTEAQAYFYQHLNVETYPGRLGALYRQALRNFAARR